MKNGYSKSQFIDYLVRKHLEEKEDGKKVEE